MRWSAGTTWYKPPGTGTRLFASWRRTRIHSHGPSSLSLGLRCKLEQPLISHSRMLPALTHLPAEPTEASKARLQVQRPHGAKARPGWACLYGSAVLAPAIKVSPEGPNQCSSRRRRHPRCYCRRDQRIWSVRPWQFSQPTRTWGLGNVGTSSPVWRYFAFNGELESPHSQGAQG